MPVQVSGGQDHFYRHLEAKLDLSFVRDWVTQRYAERGRPSIDPVIFFTLQLVMFFEGFRSSLTRIQQRLGLDVFQRFFEQVVDLCQEAGLVWGRELYVDATKVKANADLDSLVPRFAYAAKTHVADLFADESAVAEVTPALDAEPPPDIVRLPIEPCAEHMLARDDRPWRLLEERRLDPHRPPVGSYQRTTDFRISPTDPDATPMWTSSGTVLGYHDHYVVDGGKRRIILAALVTPAVAVEEAGIRAYLPLPDFVR